MLLEIALRGELASKAFGGKTGVAAASAVAGGWRPDLAADASALRCLREELPHVHALIELSWSQNPLRRPTAGAVLRILEAAPEERAGVTASVERAVAVQRQGGDGKPQPALQHMLL